MQALNLERFAYTPHGAFGKLTFPGFECYTVERPWLNNATFVSCIPEGIYNIRLGHYNRGGYPAYEILDVPGRTLIKIHRGNTMYDVEGCIAIGLGLGYLSDTWAVLNSRTTFSNFMTAMNDVREAQLTIQQYEP